MQSLKHLYRCGRTALRIARGSEPHVPRAVKVPTEFHGNDRTGWCIRKDSLTSASIVVDVGLGEDISFTESIIARYGCTVYCFDPTPRAIRYVQGRRNPKVELHEYGLAAKSGAAAFYLPNNEAHVSGSIQLEKHVGSSRIEVELLGLSDLLRKIGHNRIDLLKMDIEGAEYEVFGSAEFAAMASKIDQICVEFHHRWESFGRKATDDAVRVLQSMGFGCAWSSPESNEEFLFVRVPGSGPGRVQGRAR